MGKVVEFKVPEGIDIAKITRAIYDLTIGHVSEALIVMEGEKVVAVDVIAAIALAVGIKPADIKAVQDGKSLSEASYTLAERIDKRLGFPFMTGPEDSEYPEYGPFVTDLAGDNDDPGVSLNDLIETIRQRQLNNFPSTLP